LQEGDIIVAGSDGLFDNVEEMSILEQAIDVMQKQAKGKDLGAVAKLISMTITELAFNTSLNKKCVTPYSHGASEAFDMVYSGGKKDDICVVVGVVGSSREDARLEAPRVNT
jgi:protein phosphatase PTC7